MAFWLVQTIGGLSFGMLLFLLAAGLSLVFGLMGIINLAHGSFYLLGAYVGLAVIHAAGNFWLAVAASGLAIGILGLFLERFFLHRFLAEELAQVLLTFGLLFFIGNIALLIWGGQPATVPAPDFLAVSLPLGNIGFPVYRLFVIGIGALIAVGLGLLQERTQVGAMVRAGVDDQEMLGCLGVNVPLLFMMVFALGAFLAAVSGVVGGAFLGVYPGVDLDILLYTFVVVIIGGVGSLRGAFLGSILVGVVDNMTKALFPQLSLFAIFAIMVIVLAVKPSGLFGRGLVMTEE